MTYQYPDKQDRLTCQLIEEVNTGNYWEESEQAVLKACLQRLEGRNDHRVLDLGCGLGRLLPVMAPYASAVTGAEPDPERCGLAQILAPQAVQKAAPDCDCRIINGDVANVEVQGRGPFDVVLSSHVVQHIPFSLTKSMLSGATKLLNPGGWLFLTTTNGNDADSFTLEYMGENGQRVSEKTDEQGFTGAFGREGVLPVAFYAAEKMQKLFDGLGLDCCEILGYHYTAQKADLSAEEDARLNAAGDRRAARDILYICRKREG